MAVKDDVKRWLVDHEAWNSFWKRRDEHKAAGDPPAVAQRKALAEFYHPNDQPAVVSAQAGESAGGGNLECHE